MCIRCAGLYVTFLVTYVILTCLHLRIFSRTLLTLAIVGIAAPVADVMLESATNTSRFLCGVCAGWGLAVLMSAALHCRSEVGHVSQKEQCGQWHARRWFLPPAIVAFFLMCLAWADAILLLNLAACMGYVLLAFLVSIVICRRVRAVVNHWRHKTKVACRPCVGRK